MTRPKVGAAEVEDLLEQVHQDADFLLIVATVMEEDINTLAWCPSREDMLGYLRALSPKQLKVMIATFALDQPSARIKATYTQAAKVLGEKPGNVRSAYVYGKDRLYRAIAADYFAHVTRAQEKHLSEAHPETPIVLMRWGR